METTAIKTKVCKKCGKELNESEFRLHKSGFVLNQCKGCEKEAATARRLAKKAATVVTEVPTTLTITTKSGKTIEASTTPITGGRKATSVKTDKVLYFAPGVSRDAARIAFSAFASVPTTGIMCPLV